MYFVKYSADSSYFGTAFKRQDSGAHIKILPIARYSQQSRCYCVLSRNTRCSGRKQFVSEPYCHFGVTDLKKNAHLAAPPKSGRMLCTIQPHGATCEAISCPLYGDRAQDLDRGCWGDKILRDYLAMGVLEKICEPTPQRAEILQALIGESLLQRSLQIAQNHLGKA